MRKKIQMFDPRKGDDYLFGPVEGKTFSSLSENLFVVHAPADYAPFSAQEHILYSLAHAALISFQGIGFFCVYAVPKIIEESLSDGANWAGSSALDYFVPSEKEIEKRLALYKHISFGECLLGICKEKFPKLNATTFSDFDDLVLFSDPENLQCVLSYSESGEALLITRFFEGIDQHFARIAEGNNL